MGPGHNNNRGAGTSRGRGRETSLSKSSERTPAPSTSHEAKQNERYKNQGCVFKYFAIQLFYYFLRTQIYPTFGAVLYEEASLVRYWSKVSFFVQHNDAINHTQKY